MKRNVLSKTAAFTSPVPLATLLVALAGCATGPTTLEEFGACVGGDTEACEGEPAFGQNVTITVEGSGSGDGNVVAPEVAVDIDCDIDGDPSTFLAAANGACEDTFLDAGAGGNFVLDAAPVPGSIFGGWSGDCSGATPTCTLSFTEGPDVSFDVTAHFYLEES